MSLKYWGAASEEGSNRPGGTGTLNYKKDGGVNEKDAIVEIGIGRIAGSDCSKLLNTIFLN